MEDKKFLEILKDIVFDQSKKEVTYKETSTGYRLYIDGNAFGDLETKYKNILQLVVDSIEKAYKQGFDDTIQEILKHL